LLIGPGWDEAKARTLLEEMSTRDGDELVIDSGIALSGVAHWQPRKS
jgi:lysyl-tRNA synthetase class I